MAKEFRLQDPGEGVHEAEIVEIQVSEGDEVEDGDVVFLVETDKAAVEIPAPFTGTVEEIRVEEDEIVEVGDVLLTYTEEGEAGEEKKEEAKAAAERAEKEEEEEEEEAAEEREAAEEQEPEEEEDEEGGREAAEERGEGPVPASPATRRLARELDVELSRVPGSGPGGRVTSDDVRSFAEEGAGAEEAREEEEEVAEVAEEAAPEKEKAPSEGEKEARPEAGELPFHTLVRKRPSLPDFSRWGPVERKPLRRIRRSVARRMTQAWWEVPHVTHHEVADITALERFRREHEEMVEEEGGKLSLTVLVLKAAVAALKEHPRFNASLDVEAEEIVLKEYYNLGLAVDTSDGLVVPVIRRVDAKSLVELSREIPEMVDRIREGEASQEDLSGGTFTLTNPGPLGGTSFTPVVRYPEVAILGMAAARMEPVMVGDLENWEIEARLRLPLVLAFDHRVNDGADAARFMNTVVETLNDTDSLLLHT